MCSEGLSKADLHSSSEWRARRTLLKHPHVPTCYGGFAVVTGVPRGGKKIRGCLQGSVEVSIHANTLMLLLPAKPLSSAGPLCLRVWLLALLWSKMHSGSSYTGPCTSTGQNKHSEPCGFKFSWGKIINKQIKYKYYGKCATAKALGGMCMYFHVFVRTFIHIRVATDTDSHGWLAVGQSKGEQECNHLDHTANGYLMAQKYI